MKGKRGRPAKKHHDPINASFDEVLGAIAKPRKPKKK